MALATGTAFDPLDELIDGTLEQLDITEPMHNAAVAEYQDVGKFVSTAGVRRGVDVFVHPQGSFLLGTVVLPVGSNEFDIDLVARYGLRRTQTTQDQLKQRAGLDLHEYVQSRAGDTNGPTGCDEGARAWTLSYRQPFHLDTLPSIPDDEAENPSAILLPDRGLVRWQHSDPLAYATWFVQRGQRTLVLKEARAYVAGVPRFTRRTTLQRAVQVLKRHRDLFFADDIDNRPPSILITTLAALAYDGKNITYAAIVAIAGDMERYIENRAGQWWVANPVAPQENFVDKWAAHPERRMRFYQWLDNLKTELNAASSEGVPSAIRRFKAMFGEEPVEKAAERMGTRTRSLREQGALTIGSAGATLGTGGATSVRDHRFYGSR